MCPPGHASSPPDWEQVHAQHLSHGMPQATFLSLTDDQKVAVLAAGYDSDQGETLYRMPLHSQLAALTNPGLAYLLLATPAKYMLLSHTDEDLALELLTWDAEHLDVFHTQFKTGSLQERLLDQRFNSVCALLGNRAVTAGTVTAALTGLRQAWDTVYPDEAGTDAFAELLNDQLWDKWGPDEFPATTLAVLECFLRDQGLTAAADQLTPAALAAWRAERDD